MSSSTRQAVAAAKEIITPLLNDADLKFAEELFAIGSAVADSKQLRNILSDPSAEIAGKKAALAAVFGKSVSSKTVDFVAKLVDLRWSSGSDLVRALEQLAVHSVAAIAAKSNKLEALEAELFAFRQVVDSDQELQIALASLAAFAERLVAIVTVAAPLSESQRSALESALTKTHGHALRLNIEVDPAILGGVKVQIAGEILDGSVANRLKQARMMLA